MYAAISNALYYYYYYYVLRINKGLFRPIARYLLIRGIVRQLR